MTAAAGRVVARQVQSLHWPPFSAPSPGRGIPSVRLESNKNEYFSRHQEYLFINSNAIFRFGGRSPRHHGGTITTLGRSRDTTGFPPGKTSPSISTILWTAVTSRNFLWVIFFFGGRPAVTHFIVFTKMASGQKRTELSASCYINSKFPNYYMTVVSTNSADWL